MTKREQSRRTDETAVLLLRLELVQQCKFIGLCRESALSARDTDRSWLDRQSILTSAAMVSKICWGSNRKNALVPEREYLRGLLEIDERSPMFSRGVRNHFEHVDERISEVVIGKSAARSFLIRGATSGSLQVPGHVKLGAFDSTSGELKFLKQRVNLREIADEAERLLARVEAVGWSV